MYSSKVEPQVEVVQKTEPHEQCVVGGHITYNTDLECDPLDYNRDNKVIVLCLSCHHEHSGIHHEGEIEKASPKCLWEHRGAKTESQWLNGVVTKQKCHQRLGWRSQ